MARALDGVWTPVATPLNPVGTVDAEALLAQASRVLDEGCRGVLLFGTTGEAPSFSVGERRAALDALLQRGLPPDRIMVGVGCCAPADTLALSRHASGVGVAALLVLPPFYFKGVGDEGLHRAFAALVEGLGAEEVPLLLYHFPRLSGVPIGAALARRLGEAFPGRIVGVKDSSGDPASTRAFLEAREGFVVFPGTESVLPALCGAGIAGCISAGANVHAGALVADWSEWKEGRLSPDSRALALRAVLDRHPMIPALKAILEARTGSDAWARLRPPLVELDAARRASLLDEYEKAGA